MQKAKGFWSTVAAVTAFVCCCLGIAYGLLQHESNQPIQKFVIRGHSNMARAILYDAEDQEYGHPR
jgi:anti-sigma-K factor RskA